MPTISVQTTPSYPILIERGLLRKAGQTLRRCTRPAGRPSSAMTPFFPFTGAR